MNKEIYIKALPKCTDIDTLYIIVHGNHVGNMIRVNHKQKLLLEDAHKYIGKGAINKNCKSCLAKASQVIYAYIEQYIPATTYERVEKKVTKKKVVKKAEPWQEKAMKAAFVDDDNLKAILNDFEPGEIIVSNLKWADLKKYATSKGVKVYKKNREQILKELGV